MWGVFTNSYLQLTRVSKDFILAACDVEGNFFAVKVRSEDNRVAYIVTRVLRRRIRTRTYYLACFWWRKWLETFYSHVWKNTSDGLFPFVYSFRGYTWSRNITGHKSWFAFVINRIRSQLNTVLDRASWHVSVVLGYSWHAIYSREKTGGRLTRVRGMRSWSQQGLCMGSVRPPHICLPRRFSAITCIQATQRRKFSFESVLYTRYGSYMRGVPVVLHSDRSWGSLACLGSS